MAQTLKRIDLLKRLESIKEMSDQEIAMNMDWIRSVAESAYCHIKQGNPNKRTYACTSSAKRL